MARRLPDVSDDALEGYVRRAAIVLDELGRLDEAEPLYEESLALTRRIRGEEHSLVDHGVLGPSEIIEELFKVLDGRVVIN